VSPNRQHSHSWLCALPPGTGNTHRQDCLCHFGSTATPGCARCRLAPEIRTGKIACATAGLEKFKALFAIQSTLDKSIQHGVLAVLVLSLVIATPALFGGKANPEAGKATYTKKCATCHGAEGEGKPAIAKMMKVEMHHLGSKEIQAKSDAEVKKIVTEGSGKMKPVTGLSEQEIADLIGYLRTLKVKK
jgi:cytochrome c553